MIRVGGHDKVKDNLSRGDPSSKAHCYVFGALILSVCSLKRPHFI